MLARLHNVAASSEQLPQVYTDDGHLFGCAEILLASKKLSLKVKPARRSLSCLSHTPLPAIVSDSGGHLFFITMPNDSLRCGT
ncbi:hypothetical protein [Pseudomonas anguilliseptica]|uniref:hypothetical protein n=1 Tax=Pseudomonas anguilliseptica TaxID=53406 RepID=UPI0039C89428